MFNSEKNSSEDYYYESNWTLPFGSWKDTAIKDIPRQYLRWLVANVILFEPIRGEIFRTLGLTELKDISLKYRLRKTLDETIRDYPHSEHELKIFYYRMKRLCTELWDSDLNIEPEEEWRNGK